MPFKKAFGAASSGGRYGHSWTEDQRNYADTFRSYRPDEGSLAFCSEQERFKTTATAGLLGGSGGGTERTHAEKSMGRVARWSKYRKHEDEPPKYRKHEDEDEPPKPEPEP